MGAEDVAHDDAVMGQGEPEPGTIRERVRRGIADGTLGDEELVEALGEKFLVRSMSGPERIEIFKVLKGLRNAEGEVDEDAIAAFPHVIVRTACDPDSRERAFAPADVEWLADAPGGDLQRLGTAGLRVSGMGEEGESKAGKASSETPSDGSSSSSP